MIANLITTVLLALGVATGNVSSNSYKGGNAFNHVIKQSQPQPKRTTTTPIEIEETEFYTAQYITGSPILNATKYYIGRQNNSNYYQDSINVRNTILTYTKEMNYGGRQMFTYFYLLLEITPMLDIAQTTAYLNIDVKFESNYQHYYYFQAETFETDNTIEELIDINLTQNLQEQIADTYNRMPKINYSASGVVENQTETGYHLIIDDAYLTYGGNLIINRNETKYIFMGIWYANNEYSVSIHLEPNTFELTAQATIAEINYEVVDIPNLMFTILTLPFSFFSTAFNLTVFPNTPYAVNFGNVILTIIAAMTLLYIIKKVLK